MVRRWLRSSGGWASEHWRLVCGLGLLLGLGLVLRANASAVAGVDWSVDPLACAGAIGLLGVAPLAQALTLRIALRRLGAAAPAVGTLRVWARSFLLRYEPSGAIGYVYRVRSRERLGATTPEVLSATGYEQLAAVTAGALVGLAAFFDAGVRPPAPAWLLAGGLGIAAAALGPTGLGRRLTRWLARRGVAVAGPLPGRTLGLMVGVDAAGWAATGAGVWLLARGVLGAGAPGDLALVGAFAVSWVIGVLMPFLPGGLGPRDAALTVALTPMVGPGPAAVLAIGLRVASFAGELVAVAVAEGAALVLARRDPAVPVAPIGSLGTGSRGRGAAGGAGAGADSGGAAIASVGGGGGGGAGGAIVVVPTYDEREALPLFVARFEAAARGFELLIVDDGSPDGTGGLADELAAGRPWMHVLHRPGKDGLGVAYRAGFGWCLERGYGVIGQMDCDLSHPPEALAGMRAVLEDRGAGLVLGSRYAPGGGTDGWSAGRLALSRVGCRASRLALGLPFSDLSGGFKLWRADCLGAIDFAAMLSTGYAFQVETTQLAFLGGTRIEEFPFVFSERVAGASKMSVRITLEGIRVTLALRRHGRQRGAGGLGAAL